MSIYLALGSNKGDRKAFLRAALNQLEAIADFKIVRISPIYESPALLPPLAPTEWLSPFLNLVVQGEGTSQLDPATLLKELQSIEARLGRHPGHEHWSPREIDIDILFFNDKMLKNSDLTLPHPQWTERSFVLDPLKDLNPSFKDPITQQSVLELSHRQKEHSPLWMGILNLTPDSFSDGGKYTDPGALSRQMQSLYESGCHIFDFGAESTRAKATPLTSHEELERLRPALQIYKEIFASQWDRPLLSIDTRHPQTALELAKDFNLDIVNDVGGLRDPLWFEFLKNSTCDYVLMHSQSIPADPSEKLPEDIDPLCYLRKWFTDKMQLFADHSLSLDRLILDPGIGFGKSALQSLKILKNIHQLHDLNQRILIGHSRKSFMNSFSSASFAERDPETVAMSLFLCRQGVDILRVHNVALHTRSHLAWNHLN
ncbi:MAG: dihydropteroate synthase [Bdellovibrionales bacterium]|nr:dihydropteroate synthase [Bdellovibrionales bacterium]